MDSFLHGFTEAFRLILHMDPVLFGIILLSLKVSGLALILATLPGLPLGSLLGLKRFPGRDLAISSVNTLMGLPPVVVGLIVYLLLSRRGPLGFLGLLYSPTAMIIAQTILGFGFICPNPAGQWMRICFDTLPTPILSHPFASGVM